MPPDVKLVNLPPLGIGRNIRLVNGDANSARDEANAPRKKLILDTFTSLRPAAVVIEMFPFGRKPFAAELLPLLQRARNRKAPAPVVACSLRDILADRARNNRDLVVERANSYFDAILVHSDPAFARLEETFHAPSALRVPVHYTGFVTSDSAINPLPFSRREPRVVVSAGGGLVGGSLLRAAVESYSLTTKLERLEMRVIAGPFLPESSWRELRTLAGSKKGLILRTSVPSLWSEMAQARASISQCGYNTALDLLRSQVSGLVVPFTQGRENEQMNRALRLESLGAVRLLPEDDLNPARLVDEIQVLLHFKPRTVKLNFDGASNSARIMMELVRRRDP